MARAFFLLVAGFLLCRVAGDSRNGQIVARPTKEDTSASNDAVADADRDEKGREDGGIKVTQLDSSQYAQAHASLGNVPLAMRHKAPSAERNATAEVHAGAQRQCGRAPQGVFNVELSGPLVPRGHH